MASTKIINVLRDDKFEEVLDLFNEASAKEVILILPKKCKAFSNEDHFAILQSAALKSNKSVSLLCSSPDTNDMARKYKFDVLLNEKTDKKPTLIKTVNQISDYGSINDEDPENPEDIGVINPFKGSKLAESDEEDDDMEGEGKVKKADEDEEEDEDTSLDGFGIVKDEIPIRNEKKIALNEDDDEDEDEDDEKDEEELKEVEDEDEDEEEGIVADVSDTDEERYRIITASVRKNLDDIVRQSDEDIRNLKINRAGLERVKIGIRKSKSDRNFDKIKEVWDETKPWNSTERPKRFQGFKNFFKSRSAADEAYSYPARKTGRRTVRMTMYAGATVFVLCILGFFVFKGSANITVAPYSTSISPQIKVLASDMYSTLDVTQNRIPGQLLSASKTVSRTFNATGEKDVAQKARGKITVSNDQTTSQSLVNNTRFQNSAGLIFRTLQSINIPAGKTIIVDVIADKAGSEYNIVPSSFVVSSFKESGSADKLAKVYGKSSENMKGGTSGKAKVVTESDYNNAKSSLMIDLKSEIEAGLKSQSESLKVVSTTAITAKDPVSSAQIDEAADTFTMSLSGSVKTIAFKEDALNELIKSNVEKKGDIVVLPEKLDKSYDNVKFNSVDSVLEFTVTAKGLGYAKVDTTAIIDGIVGKPIDEAKSFLEKMTASKIIRSANVRLSYIWMQKMPDNKSKIKVELAY